MNLDLIKIVVVPTVPFSRQFLVEINCHAERSNLTWIFETFAHLVAVHPVVQILMFQAVSLRSYSRGFTIDESHADEIEFTVELAHFWGSLDMKTRVNRICVSSILAFPVEAHKHL